MDERISELKRQSEAEFASRDQSLLPFWQDVAENFYPQRADFTVSRSTVEDFAGDLATSYPLLACRELKGSLGAMLRPSNDVWMGLTTMRPERLDIEGRRWLEWAGELQYRAMHDRKAKLDRACDGCDGDYVAFGQGVIQVGLNRAANGLLYQNWHLRDVAWCEDAEGDVSTVFRRQKPTAYQLEQMFPGKVSEKVSRLIREKKGYSEKVEIRHVVMPSATYEPPRGRRSWRQPFVSIFFEQETGQILEEIGSWTKKYVIPRWQLVMGAQYACSPAVTAAFPQARMLQAMVHTLLDAGAMAVRPPLIGQDGVVRDTPQVYDGGITWVDAEYDERLGPALRPLLDKFDGVPLGIDMADRAQALIADAFFLNKINLPPPDREMTAYEVGQRMSIWLREVLPLFKPIISDYNGALCDETFECLRYAGAFGTPDVMPESLQGAEVQFTFKSPLTEALEERKGQKFREVAAMLAEAAQFDPSVVQAVDARTALRDALVGIGAPSTWHRTDDEIEAAKAAEAEAAQNEMAMQTAERGVAMLKQGAEAEAALARAA